MTNTYWFTKDWKLLLFGFLMSFFSIPGQTVYISLFSGNIRRELALTHGEFGAVYSLATLCSAALIVWSGSLADKIALGRMSTAVVLTLGVACLLIAQSTTVSLLFISIFLLRHAGQGLMTLCGITALVRYISAYKGKSTAVGNMGYSLAEASMPITIVTLLTVITWRQSWLLVAATLILVMLPAIWILLRDHSQRHRQYKQQLDQDILQQRQWRRSEVIRHTGFYLVVPAIMGHSFLYTGFVFHQIHLLEVKGWQIQHWASLFIMYSLVAIASMLLIGTLIDKLGAFRLLPIAPLCMAIATGILFLADSMMLAAAALFCMGISGGASTGISAPFWVEAYGSKHLAAIKSLAYALVVLFSSLSPVVFGWLLDTGTTMNQLLLGGSLYSVLSLILIYLSRPFFRRS